MSFIADITLSLMLLSVLCIPGLKCNGVNKESELLDHIFTGYNKHARPVTNLSSSIDVEISFYLTSYEMAEESQELLTRGWFSLIWKNELLAWNVTEYQVTNLVVSPSMVWLPSVTIFNSNDDRNAMIKRVAGVQIFPDGTTSWWPDIATKTSCQISVQKYPFDKQKCEIELTAWLRNIREQQFRASKNEIIMTSHELNTEWEFIKSSVEVERVRYASLSSVKISIEVKRHAFYQIVHTLIPILLLSYMNCFIFIIPINSGENTSFGVAIFLAFAVFIGPVKESLPVTSTETCILTVYMIVQFCVGGLETCLSCITLRLASRTTRVKTNSWWNKLKDIASLLKSRERKVSPMPVDPQIMIEQLTKADESGNKAQPQVISTIAIPHPDVVLTEHVECCTGSPSISVDWTTVGTNLNVLLFIFFISIKTILRIMFLIMVTS